MPPPLDILYEDNHLLAINKPAGLPTIGVAADRTSLVKLAKAYLKHRYRKPGNVYLGVMSRLDAPVSGVVLLARTSKAAARLTEQFRTRLVRKIYWAIVGGEPEAPAGEWVDWIKKDESQRRMVVANSRAPGAQEARLRFRRIAELPIGTLLEIELLTGRKHQIRLQCSTRGLPIVGDRKYGGRTAFPAGIALHARQLIVTHPVGGKPLKITAAPPSTWPKLKNLAE